jgi:hypothetical protein
MSGADWLEWLRFRPVDFDRRLEAVGATVQKETPMSNRIDGIWLNFFGWQRPLHWPIPKPTEDKKRLEPSSKPDPNPLGWSDEALVVMDDLEELFD